MSMALLGIAPAGQHATGSMATGAKLACVTMFVAGLAGPIRGRLLDRKELRGGLQCCCFLSGFVFSMLTVTVWISATDWMLYGLCAVEVGMSPGCGTDCCAHWHGGRVAARWAESVQGRPAAATAGRLCASAAQARRHGGAVWVDVSDGSGFGLVENKRGAAHAHVRPARSICRTVPHLPFHR
jgi:hypothetical protein